MGKKWCVKRCNGNFDDGNKATVFRFPRDPAENVCRRHWPAKFEFTIVRGKIKPVNPLSKNVLPDEHNAFQKADVIKTFGELQNKLVDNKHNFARFSTFPYLVNDCIIIQSVEFEQPSRTYHGFC